MNNKKTSKTPSAKSANRPSVCIHVNKNRNATPAKNAEIAEQKIA
jgi:hypothetical protein